MGIPQSTLHKYVKGERFPGTSALTRLAAEAGIPLAEAIAAVVGARNLADDQMFVAEHYGLHLSSEPSAGYVSLALLDAPVSAGPGAAVQSHPAVLRHVDVLESWATSRLGSDLSRVRLVTVRGDSMQPTLSAGDVLFVDAEQREYSAEGLYVLSRGGDVFVKRLQMRSRGVLAVISDNPVYPVELLADADLADIVICGRVLASWSLRQLS